MELPSVLDNSRDVSRTLATTNRGEHFSPCTGTDLHFAMAGFKCLTPREHDTVAGGEDATVGDQDRTEGASPRHCPNNGPQGLDICDPPPIKKPSE